MNLSSKLLNDFIKISTPEKTENDTVVYGTAVIQSGHIYVKIDGSESLTPAVSTSEIKPTERVMVMLKNHQAIITGNISNPSASTGTVDDVKQDITTITADVANIKLLVADKINTEELEAALAKINEAIIGKADIKDLEALNAKIENLDVDTINAELTKINEAIIGKADITDLNAAVADIKTLKTEFADINTLVGGNLTMDNIQSLVLTSSKVTVDNAFIKNAMIDTISADKINTGTINTNLINIESKDGSMNINGSLQQFKDANGNVRIQIGKDSTGDFTFVLYGEDGTGQLINQNGITSSAIGDGLIIDKMVANDANISGAKLDITSVITEINNDSTTIKSSKIYFDEKQQTLDVVLNSMTTKTNELENTVGNLSTRVEVANGKIETLISDTTITTVGGETVKLKDDYSAFKITVDGISSKVLSLETNYGKTLKSTRTEYYVSLSNVTPSGGSWSEESPTWLEGKYIWQRLVFVYSDDTEVDGTPVCIQGAKGADGESGLPGEPGEPGPPGRSITSVTQQFTKHNSPDVPPDESAEWLDKCPTYEVGTYLWIRTKILYDNPVEERYSAPYYDMGWDAKSTAEEVQTSVNSKLSEFNQTLDGFDAKISSTEAKYDNLEFPITNLLLNSGEFESDKYWGPEESISPVVIDEDHCIHIENEASQAIYKLQPNTAYMYWAVIKMESASEITLNGPIDCYCGWSETNEVPKNKDGCTIEILNDTTTINQNEWTLVKLKVVTKNGMSGQEILFQPRIVGTMDLKYIALEKGTKTSYEWTPSQAQVAESTDDAINDATIVYDTEGNPVYVKDLVTTINATVNGISSSVSSLEKHFDKDGTIDQINNKISEFQQLSDKFTFEFWNKFESTTNGMDELHDYITFSSEGITIGQTNYPIRLILSKDKVKFIDQNNNELAYFTDDKLYIQNAEIIDTIKIANYGLLPTAGGSLTIAAIR